MSFKDIGLKIQIAREEKGMSQEQLSRLLGCSQSALSNYEKGKRRLYLSQLEKMADILGKPLEYFVEALNNNRESENLNGHNEQLMYAINQIKKLNDDEVNDVIDYISYLEWKKSGRA